MPIGSDNVGSCKGSIVKHNAESLSNDACREKCSTLKYITFFAPGDWSDSTPAKFAGYNSKFMLYHNGADKTGDGTCPSNADEANCIPKNKSGCLGYEHDSGTGNCTLFDGVISGTPDDTKANTKCYNRLQAKNWGTLKTKWTEYITLKTGDYKAKKDLLTSGMNSGWDTYWGKEGADRIRNNNHDTLNKEWLE